MSSPIFTTEKSFVTLKGIADLCTVCKKTVNLNTDIKEEDTREVSFNENRKKLPADLWSAIIHLYIDICKKFNGEVRVELCKHRITNEWKVLVPKQQISGASVTKQDLRNTVDILTGEKFNLSDPAFVTNWYQFGTSHSHGSIPMDTFSETDDKEELFREGPHLLVSHIKFLENNKVTYVPTGSIVWDNERTYVDIYEIVDIDPTVDVMYHPNCLNQISRQVFNSKVKHYSKKSNANFSNVTKLKKTDYPYNQYYNDDFWGEYYNNSYYGNQSIGSYKEYNDDFLLTDTNSIEFQKVKEIMENTLYETLKGNPELVEIFNRKLVPTHWIESFLNESLETVNEEIKWGVFDIS